MEAALQVPSDRPAAQNPDGGLPDGVTPLTDRDPVAIGPYRVLGVLGSGGMGTVYLAIFAGSTRRLVAAKVVHPQLAYDEHFRARFRAEARLACRVASFSTAPVLDYGESGGLPYLITEYIEGVALDDMARRKGPLPESAVHGVAISIAAALTSIHNAGLVHRDLKPGNVVLSLSGARVIDFGIARALDTPSALTRSGVAMGSPGWMAPEQVLGKPITSAADVFAWGCLVAYAATARHPFGAGDAAALAYRTVHEEPVLDGVPESLRPMVACALRPRPEQRPTAYEILTRLSGSTAIRPAAPHPEPGEPTSAAQLVTATPVAAARPGGAARRYLWSLLGGGALLCVIALAAIEVAYPNGVADRPTVVPDTPGAGAGRQGASATPADPSASRSEPGGSKTASASGAPPDASEQPSDVPRDPTPLSPSATRSSTRPPSDSPSETGPPTPTPTDPPGSAR